VSSSYVLLLEGDWITESEHEVPIGIELAGSEYRGYPGPFVCVSCEDTRLLKHPTSDRTQKPEHSHIDQRISLDRILASPELLPCEREIGRDFITGGRHRNSDAIELLFRVAGVLGPSAGACRFTDAALAVGFPFATGVSMVYHRSVRGFALDFLRTYISSTYDLDFRAMYPVFDWEYAMRLVSAIEKQGNKYPSFHPETGPEFGGSVAPIPEMTAEVIKRLLNLPESEYRRRMRSQCSEIPCSSWFDFGDDGVAIAVPLFHSLTDVFRHLAGLAACAGPTNVS